MAFTQRTTAPTKDDRWFYADNPYYLSGYGLPNCTCYAWGRFAEIMGSAPALSLRNAENWWSHNDGYPRGQTPKVGAVICWRKGVAGESSDGAGHVAVVEQINSDGSIVTSESGWNSSTLWWRKTRSNSTGRWGQSSAYTFQGFIYNPALEVTQDTSNAKKIWDYLLAKIGNPYGVAGLMGNLEAESLLHADIVQGDLPYSSYSKEYTAKVDNGTISEYDFVHNGPGGGGYGLAQWTYYTRKQGLYNLYKSGGYSSIGSLALALDYLWYELQNSFSGVLSVLKNATSVREASNKVLFDFENPANQGTSMQNKRTSMGQAWYNKYIDSEPGSGDIDEPGSGGVVMHPITAYKSKKLPLWLIASATRRRV